MPLSNDLITKEYEQDFYLRLRKSIIDILKDVRSYIDSGGSLDYEHKFPSFKYINNGLPTYWPLHGILKESPVKYLTVYSTYDKSRRKSLPKSCDALWELILSNSIAKNFYTVKNDPYSEIYKDDDLPRLLFNGHLKDMANFYIHRTGLNRYRRRLFSPIFRKYFTAIHKESLDIRIIVPILILDFEIRTSFQLNSITSIIRMDDDIQLARAPIEDPTVSVNKHLIGAATHAFVVDGWYFPNNSLSARQESIYSLEAFSKFIPVLDTLFSCLRIVSGFNTGYGQIVSQPIDWCDKWKANQEGVYQVQTRAYPDGIEYKWRVSDRSIVTKSQLTDLKNIFASVDRIGSNRIATALKRLNTAYLAYPHDDSIIDICIALETLLTNDSNAEITHKLATRLAAIWSLDSSLDYSASEVFTIAKKIYTFRSKVVHGNSNLAKHRQIVLGNNRRIDAIKLGLYLLRHSIRLISQYPEYLDKHNIDLLLLN